MNPILKPAYHLMNKLKYRGKFALICSVFAIPLAIFVIQLANSYHLAANQEKLTQEGLVYIAEINVLVQELETLRDLNVTTSWRANPDFEALHRQSRNASIRKIEHLANLATDPNSRLFLEQLKAQISSNEMAKGTESRSIDVIYEADQAFLDKVHYWRAKLSYNFISFGGSNSHILSIINILNETHTLTRVLGEARAFGSLYLTQKFVDSHGVKVLEETYQKLSQAIDLIDVKAAEYQTFFSAYPEVSLDNVKDGLMAGREQLYKQLIAAPELTREPLAYFQQLSENYQNIYQYNQHLFDLSNQIVEQDYQTSIRQLWLFYAGVLCLVLLLIYLGIGLYHSISVSVGELLKSAANFSNGQYDKPVKVVTHDELMAVATAMDSMRLNIKEREEKLALMSQTDGLTKLSNRKFFDQAMKVSLANSRRQLTPLTIVMMDIDFFKKVNDQYGHLAGDDCLIKIAKLMKSQFKRQTDVVARYGGEEFIAILYGQGLDEATAQTEKLRALIESSTITSGEVSYQVTASFGLACLVPPEDAKPEDLISLADSLLYQSKENGRNCLRASYFKANKA